MKLQAAKLRLSVCFLSGDDTATADVAYEIDELHSYSSTFCINQIPNATINIPIGSKLEGDQLFADDRFRNWFQLIQDRTPVGVILEVDSKDGIEGFRTGKYCLFRGYPVSVNPSYSAKQGTLQITLQHWLSDLTLIPILNPLSSPENPANIACENVFRAAPQTTSNDTTNINDENKGWLPLFNASTAVLNMHTDKRDGALFECIKGIFTSIAETDYTVSKEHPGYKSDELYKKVIKTLDNIQGEYLDLHPDFDTEDSPALRTGIAGALTAMTESSFYSVTIWDKLISTLLPSFYMCLVPLVNCAKVVPSPGIHMPEKEKPDITPDNTVQLNINMAKNGMLAGMALISRPIPNSGGTFPVSSGGVTNFRYPTDTKPGVFKICQLPSWLELFAAGHETLQLHAADPLINFADPSQKILKDADAVNTTLTEQAEKAQLVFEKLCTAFVHTAYNAEVTKHNSALLIANIDFARVPGSTIRIQLPSTVGGKGTSTDIYGVITTVGHTIAPGIVQASYRINNVRDPILREQLDSTSSGALLYQEGWDSSWSMLSERLDD